MSSWVNPIVYSTGRRGQTPLTSDNFSLYTERQLLDDDPSENFENEREQGFVMNDLFTTERPEPKLATSSLNSDSLAFTLVYCSVFTITIVYIGYKLSKKWRRQSTQAAAAGAMSAATSEVNVRCNHAACHEALTGQERAQILPYSGLGAIWIPELRSWSTRVPTAAAAAIGMPPVHHTGHCNNSCDNCRKLSAPPPSYVKLFLEENPPTYHDAVNMADLSRGRPTEGPRAALAESSLTEVAPMLVADGHVSVLSSQEEG